MKKETFYCDIKGCEKEVAGSDLFTVAYTARKNGYSPLTKTYQVCQACALKIGLVKLEKEAQKPPLSEADELHGIIADMIQDGIEDAQA